MHAMGKSEDWRENEARTCMRVHAANQRRVQGASQDPMHTGRASVTVTRAGQRGINPRYEPGVRPGKQRMERVSTVRKVIGHAKKGEAG
jgi:hypothetical protein